MHLRRELTILFVIIVGCLGYSQTVPSCFSWDKVKNGNSILDFVPTPQQQPFEDPCLSYAFVSAIQTTYNIESSSSSNPNRYPLAVPYLDVKVFSADMSLYESRLENHIFKIPQKLAPTGAVTRYSEFLPGVTNWQDSRYNNYRSTALSCMNNENHFRIGRVTETTNVWTIKPGCGPSIGNGNSMTVKTVQKVNRPSSINVIKKKIIDDGPIVMKIGKQILSNFIDYNVTSINYHAVTIVGWEDQPNGKTKWHITNSSAGGSITKALNDYQFLSYMGNSSQSYKTELYSVSGIALNGNVSNNGFAVNYSEQCQENNTVVLSPIDMDGPHEVWVGSLLYSSFRVESNIPVDDWQWWAVSAYTRSQIDASRSSNILVSPMENGYITIKARAKKNGIWSDWKSRRIYLANGSDPGMY